MFHDGMDVDEMLLLEPSQNSWPGQEVLDPTQGAEQHTPVNRRYELAFNWPEETPPAPVNLNFDQDPVPQRMPQAVHAQPQVNFLPVDIVAADEPLPKRRRLRGVPPGLQVKAKERILKDMMQKPPRGSDIPTAIDDQAQCLNKYEVKQLASACEYAARVVAKRKRERNDPLDPPDKRTRTSEFDWSERLGLLQIWNEFSGTRAKKNNGDNKPGYDKLFAYCSARLAIGPGLEIGTCLFRGTLGLFTYQDPRLVLFPSFLGLKRPSQNIDDVVEAIREHELLQALWESACEHAEILNQVYFVDKWSFAFELCPETLTKTLGMTIRVHMHFFVVFPRRVKILRPKQLAILDVCPKQGSGHTFGKVRSRVPNAGHYYLQSPKIGQIWCTGNVKPFSGDCSINPEWITTLLQVAHV